MKSICNYVYSAEGMTKQTSGRLYGTKSFSNKDKYTVEEMKTIITNVLNEDILKKYSNKLSNITSTYGFRGGNTLKKYKRVKNRTNRL